MEEVSVGEWSANGAQAAAGTLEQQASNGAVQTDADSGSGLLGRVRRLAVANPLRFGLMAVILGVALAAIVPSTRFENELLGEGADLAKERLNARARDLWQRTKTAAQRASEAAVAAALEEFRRES